ncbi:MAG: response regulator [Goleter apudmare HA4340-LM2]|jgi:PAS domain S-box-containing protein|nr:response regulator [Goleter apudmare HA4340-LM2]
MLSKIQTVKSLHCLIEKLYARVPLRTVLILPFVLQICGSVGLVGYVSYQNGQKAVTELATQLENEICDRIEQHLQHYLTTPQQINQINADAIHLGLLDLSDLETTGHYFWQQMRVFNIGYNKFANPQGEFIGIERLDNGNLLINEVSAKRNIGQLYVYTTNNQGNRRHFQQLKKYDPRFKTWYLDAVNRGKPVWSQIYQWEDKPEVLSISSSYPLYDRTHKLIGVIGIDLLLSQISSFLANLKVGRSGKTFILERSGLIVASSDTEPPYQIIGGKAKRLLALESKDFVIRRTTQYLMKRFGSLELLTGKQQLNFRTKKANYFVQVNNWQDELGLDWLIVLVIPEADFMEQIHVNNSITILLCIATLIVAIQIGILTARWIIQPILQLNVSAQKIAAGDWAQIVETERSDELGKLAKSFNSMAKQMQESFAALEAKHIEMKMLNDSLSTNESRLTQFLEAMPMGVLITDDHGQPYYTNQIGKQILGQGVMTTANTEGTEAVEEFDATSNNPLYYSVHLPIKRALQGESVRVDDLEIRHPEKIIPIEVLGTPIYDESGNVAFAIATFVDITKRKQTEKLLAQHNRILESYVKKRTQELLKVINQLQSTQKELIQSQKNAAKGQKSAEQANYAKSEFLANMSHELRTPLNAILGFAQVMSNDDSLSTEHQQNLAIINRAGEHLLNLINDILEMSKIEAGKSNLNISSFDLIRLLESLEEMLRFRAISQRLELVFEYAPDLPQYVQTDEGKLRQVLLNLLGNALKFTQTGRVTLRVAIWDEEKTSPHLYFEVLDTGPGIAPQEIGLLFEAFGQTETGRKSQQGTGLGLAISRKYVQLMGGEITATSILGKGSRFAFHIQIGLASAKEVQTYKNQGHVICLAPAQAECRILVVDDARDSRLLLVKLLTSIGFAVQEATNGQEALAQWIEWQPHLIFMDMRMPVMDGYEATKVIKARKIRYFQQSPCLMPPSPIIIALTASAFEEERQKILATGCDDFIRKPFTQELLLAKVSEHLGVKYISQVETANTIVASQKIQTLPSEADLRGHLSQMPSEWLGDLRHAAASCSDGMILELLEQVPSDQSQLFGLFRDLANNYQFEKIMELTRTNPE